MDNGTPASWATADPRDTTAEREREEQRIRGAGEGSGSRDHAGEPPYAWLGWNRLHFRACKVNSNLFFHKFDPHPKFYLLVPEILRNRELDLWVGARS